MDSDSQSNLEECINKILDYSLIKEFKVECEKCGGYDRNCNDYLPINKLPV
jgi:hypothetical protein